MREYLKKFIPIFLLLFPVSASPLLFLSFLIQVYSLLSPFFITPYYLFSCYQIFITTRGAFSSDNVPRSIHSCLASRSIRKRARNITLHVNKYFSNKNTRCECTPLFHPFSLFPFSPFPLFFLFNLAHTARPICSMPISFTSIGETYCPVRK